MSSRKRRPNRLLAGALLAATMFAAGCSSTTDTAAGSATADPDTAEAADTGGPRLEPSVLSGQATTVTGETFELGSLADKDLVVWFWAPW